MSVHLVRLGADPHLPVRDGVVEAPQVYVVPVPDRTTVEHLPVPNDTAASRGAEHRQQDAVGEVLGRRWLATRQFAGKELQGHK